MADKRLLTFQAVAKYLSFTKAAESLALTQPAVTFQIRQLEDQYNARLFDRGHGKISLTPAGRLVLDYTERIMDLFGELEMRLAEMTGEMRGSLLIGASTSIAEYLLPKLLGEFNARHPLVQARLIVANSETIKNHVAEHSIDLGLIDSDAAIPSTVKAEICCEDELLVICAPDHPLAKLSEVDPKMLSEYEYIAREPGSGNREAMNNYFRNAGIDAKNLKIIMELGGPEVLKGVVASGLGFGVASRPTFVKEAKLGTLVSIPLVPPLKYPLLLIYPKERFHTRIVSTFIDLVQQRLRADKDAPPGDDRTQ